MQNCTDLYEPDPDIAGTGTILAFFIHTTIFVILALLVTPLVEFYLPHVGEDVIAALEEAGEVEAVEGSPRDDDPAVQPPQHIVYRCFCREAIQNTYTSQYIAGVAYIITAFIKSEEVSSYHLFVIYCLAALNSCIGLASLFYRPSRLRFTYQDIFGIRHPGHTRQKKWSAVDVVFCVNMLLFAAFGLFVLIKSAQDTVFLNCHKGAVSSSVVTFLWISILFLLVLITTPSRLLRYHSAVTCLFFTLGIIGFIYYQISQFVALRDIFKPRPKRPGDNSESDFTFGQILILFMLVPLLGDFGGAFLADIRRIQQHAPSEWRLRSLNNLVTVLFPFFKEELKRDVREACVQAKRLLSWISARLSTALERPKRALKAYREKMSKANRNMRRSNTQLEAQDGAQALSIVQGHASTERLTGLDNLQPARNSVLVSEAGSSTRVSHLSYGDRAGRGPSTERLPELSAGWSISLPHMSQTEDSAVPSGGTATLDERVWTSNERQADSGVNGSEDTTGPVATRSSRAETGLPDLASSLRQRPSFPLQSDDGRAGY